MAATVVDINDARTAVFPTNQNQLQEFNDVIDRRLASFKQIAFRVLGNTEDAEDAVQDAFLSAYKHLDQFEGRAQMSTWLATILLNKARMQLRQRRRQVQILDTEDREQDKQPFSNALVHYVPSPEEVCQSLEVWERILHSLSRLAPPLRKTFQLCQVDGFSIREAAHVMGVPEGTVKTRLARVRKKLRQSVRKRLVRKRGSNVRQSAECD